MNQESIMAMTDANIMNTYRRTPIALVKGEGARVWDAEGRQYLDFIAGIAVCNLGHAHPAVVEAIRRQALDLMHVSNLYYTRPQAEVARILVEHSFADKAFFCNSGAEANEAAIKLARKYAHENLGPDKCELLTMKDSFHGRTMATITATGQEKFQFGFTPLLDGFRYIPFNDPEALEAAITPRTCGVMLEPIQGEGGVIIPAEHYLARVREICDRYKILMIVDEVQTGIGRTGKLFAYEYSGIKPDIMTLAKALGNGFPVGAMLAVDGIARAFGPGNHASTFGGNPVSCAAALATVGLLTPLQLAGIKEKGEYLLSSLKELAGIYPVIKDVRGRGLMAGMELETEGAGLLKHLMEDGYIVNCTREKVIRFLPPFIINNEDIDGLVYSAAKYFKENA